MLAGDHVTDDAGTGFVHTAPSHGREDFDAWMDAAPCFARAASKQKSPSPSAMTALYQGRAGLRPGSAEGGPARVIDDNGKKGDANKLSWTR
jgi:isoleucyl-tRNA synthetase